MMAALAQQGLRVVVAALLAVAPLSAGINRWTPIGPQGGDPANLAVAPSAPGVVYLGCVYVGCNEGIFRSDDGGAHWHQQGPFGYLSGLIVDPHDAETLYAPIDVSNEEGTFSIGVVKSTDGGATWKRADQGLESSEDSFVTPNLVFAGAGRLLAPTDHGIYETVDGGASWHPQSLTGVNVLLLASDPSDSAHWLASTGDVLETHDAGRSWSSTNFTLGVPVQMLSVGNCLYTITYVSYETTVSFFRRLDGRAWEPILFLPSGVRPVALAASPQGILYLATTLGAYRSLDQGTTWRPGVRSGGGQARPDDYLVDVTVVPGSPDAVLTSGYSEIWRSGDAGTTWQPSSAGLYGNEFDALTVAADSTVYAAVTTQGIFRSRDRGATWRKRTVGLGLGPPQPPTNVDFTISALAADPHDSAHLYAAISIAAAGATTRSIAHTTDAGDHWQYSSSPAGTAVIRSLQVDPASSEGLYAIADVDTIVPAVLHSFDGGKTWSHLLTDAKAILSLAIDPQRPTTLYAGTFDRFLKSVDRGRSWRQAGRGLPRAASNVLAVDPQDSRRLYAGPAGGGVYVSDDEGESFHPMNRGLPAGTGAYQLVVDPRGSFLYLLDPQHGIFRWLPEAQTWTMVEDGLPPRFRESRSYLFAIDPARPDVLYAGGQYGLFQLTVR